jgi:alpha 1,2-mannosyltransferase
MRITKHRLILASLIVSGTLYTYLLRPSFRIDNGPHFLSSLLHHGGARVPLSSSTVIVYHNSTASKPILEFWKGWARHIADAKPKTEPVQVTWAASNIAVERSAAEYRLRPVSHLSLSDKEIESLKLSHTTFRNVLDGSDMLDASTNLFEGSGIVTVVGGEYFGPAIVGIKMLRQNGSNLPVEAFLPDWDEYEEEICEQTLPMLNARCVVLSDFVASATREEEQDSDTRFKITHYQLKALAILFSTFTDVLYLDSDSIPLVDPSQELFMKEPYTTTGFVGWPDFWIGTEAPDFYAIAGLESFPKDTLPPASSESGQLLVCKSKHLKTLLLAAYYNVWGDWFYPLLSQGAMGEGDKNTFETAAFVLGLPFYRVKAPVMAIGRYINGDFRGSGMVQFHPGDDLAHFGNGTVNGLERRQVSKPLGSMMDNIRPAFLHANTPKMNAGHLVDEGDLADSTSGHAVRLWGTLDLQLKVFGEDLEKRVWTSVVEVGCELAGILKEWKQRKDVCKRLKAHWEELF